MLFKLQKIKVRLFPLDWSMTDKYNKPQNLTPEDLKRQQNIISKLNLKKLPFKIPDEK